MKKKKDHKMMNEAMEVYEGIRWLIQHFAPGYKLYKQRTRKKKGVHDE